jgi:RES domain-containing protein
MAGPSAALETLAVDAIALTGETWWRHARVGLRFAAVPNPPPDGRWQHGSVVAALYLADSEASAWAEHYRGLAERGLPPGEGFPRNLWRCEVSLARVADLSSPERLAAVGLSAPRPMHSDWPPFQLVGERLFAAGWAAVLAPSAARPDDGRSLAVFRRGGAFPGVRPPRRPRRIDRPPDSPGVLSRSADDRHSAR